MYLRLQEAKGDCFSGADRHQEVLEAVLGQGRRAKHPHVVGLVGVRDAREVEELIWPLNRALGPHEATYVTWLSGGGPEGQMMAVLSLFPLAGFQDLFHGGQGPRALYCTLDAPEGSLHVILTAEVPHEGDRPQVRIWAAKAAARLVGIILGHDPGARVLIMGDVERGLLFQGLPQEASLGCVFCPEAKKSSPGVMLVHPIGPWAREPEVEVLGKKSGSFAVKVQWPRVGR